MISIESLLTGIEQNHMPFLAHALTIIESSKPEHFEFQSRLLSQMKKASKLSKKIAFSGPPGAGKSTLITEFALRLVNNDRNAKIAIITIDPSSKFTKGALLGDKTRMTRLMNIPNIFIRPCSSSGNLGGISDKTMEMISVFEFANYDYIITETVGVGQSEISAYFISDLFILTLIPNSGDWIQAMKKGVLEVFDLIVMNKSDLDPDGCGKSSKELLSSLELKDNIDSDLVKKRIFCCSSITGSGIDELISATEYCLNNEEMIERKKVEKSKNFEVFFEEKLTSLYLSRVKNVEKNRKQFDLSIQNILDNKWSLNEGLEFLMGNATLNL